MEIGFSLSAKLEQKQIISQSMKLSLKILQMSLSDLEGFLKEEQVKNPFLKVEWPQSRGSSYRDDEYDPYKSLGDSEPSFYDYLYNQIMELNLKDEIANICRYIVDNVDERGYLSHFIRHPFKQSKFDKALEIVRTLEPKGVGADTLEECLLLQVDKSDSFTREVIENHLEDIAYLKPESVAKKLGTTVKKIEEAIEKIRKLNPLPSRGFYIGKTLEKVSPDAYIEVEDEEISIRLNRELIPKISVEGEEGESKEKGYERYKNCNISKAEFIIKCIEQRERTFSKILEEVVKKQRSFFYGKTLTPLTLKEISETLDLHESTISRAIKNRYIDFRGRSIPLRELFVKRYKSKLKRLGFKVLSIDDVKEKLKVIIEAEDKKKPYSDDDIVEIFKGYKIAIARRTIAKYRKEMGIGSSRQRRR